MVLFQPSDPGRSVRGSYYSAVAESRRRSDPERNVALRAATVFRIPGVSLLEQALFDAGPHVRDEHDKKVGGHDGKRRASIAKVRVYGAFITRRTDAMAESDPRPANQISFG